VPPPPAASVRQLNYREPPVLSSSSLPAASQKDRTTALPEREENRPDLAEPTIPAGATPRSTETGRASWYGPPYHNRRGSNGEVYNMHAMTAAHRTLPLGSIVRVTNLEDRPHGAWCASPTADRSSPGAFSIYLWPPRASSTSTSPAWRK
jgi:rare lipoprotein A